MFAAVERALTRLCRALALAGGCALLAAIGITCLSIIGKLLRRLIVAATDADANVLPWLRPILGEEELVQYAAGFALFAALPWLTLQNGHITINLLEKKFSRAVNHVLDIAGHLIFTIVIYLMLTQQWHLIFSKARRGADSLAAMAIGGDWSGIASRLRLRDESQILGMKLWPLYTVAELCVLLLFIVSVFCTMRAVRALNAPPSTTRDFHARRGA